VGWRSVVQVSEKWRQELPDGLELMAPGPVLAGVLAGLDRAALAGPDLIVLARARARQLAYEQAQQLADVLEIASVAINSLDETDRIVHGDKVVDFADDEVAAALSWTSLTAARQVELAEQSIRRLPAVHTAMLSGQLDAAKARVICTAVRVLDDDDVARAVVARILPGAGEKTTAQLRAKLARLILKADPDAARRRYTNSLAFRRVEHGQEEDGTWLLGGRVPARPGRHHRLRPADRPGHRLAARRRPARAGPTLRRPVP
jgi:Domain of unknown function (DUF222)